ncbi:hypothetical protein [Bradyrhizobium sp.]|uniref:hypothetical protein n=1 Tax=Bradyrhizobium sp. TaxID=376 RepID=UPI003C7861FD
MIKKFGAQIEMAAHFTSKANSRWRLPQEILTVGEHDDILRRSGFSPTPQSPYEKHRIGGAFRRAKPGDCYEVIAVVAGHHR